MSAQVCGAAVTLEDLQDLDWPLYSSLAQLVEIDVTDLCLTFSMELTQAVYPRAHTCFNRIDVPLYRTKEELVAGFEFVLELGDQTFTMD